MKLDKPKIKKVLSGIIDSHDIININHFDKEIIIDINSTNPTLKHNKSVANQAFVDVKVTTDGGSTFYHVAKKVNIPPSNTLTLDKPINLESSDKLNIGKFKRKLFQRFYI